MGQHFVTRLMPVLVINAFEMVKIDLYHRKRLTVLSTVLRNPFCALKQRAAVIQTREGIVPGLPLQGVLQGVHIADHPADDQP